MITVRVPATTANLGPGFDCFGLALGVYAELSFEERENGFVFDGVDPRYCTEDNLAVQAYFRALKELNIAPGGLFVRIKSDIPVSRGMGSSASLIAAALTAANAAHGNALSAQTVLNLATELEGHPDNVAPALMGGLTVSMMQDGQVISIPCPISDKVKVCILVPDFELSTHLARGVLPATVPYADAVFNASHAAVLIKALEAGDMNAISLSLRDKLHQPYRKSLIDEYDTVQSLAFKNGAAAFAISGAGPSLLCVTDRDDFAALMKNDLSVCRHTWRVLSPAIDTDGATVL